MIRKRSMSFHLSRREGHEEKNGFSFKQEGHEEKNGFSFKQEGHNH